MSQRSVDSTVSYLGRRPLKKEFGDMGYKTTRRDIGCLIKSYLLSAAMLMDLPPQRHRQQVLWYATCLCTLGRQPPQHRELHQKSYQPQQQRLQQAKQNPNQTPVP
ncbi:uncharacterized protein EKO05_0008080 [Ascochyta rabiei]|uniref:uncharacterized protein n=1 Tax=Didymella rabiei TaxID=5454 RepID=UPI002202A3E0|nr:uncharacterized protein EKO05_0008080 [Ascochyta rabiei]UPX17740.1 hypothetical protein EKO05_0008080 [Ascochyta rabiei]